MKLTVLAIALGLTALAVPAAASDPLPHLIGGKEGSSACFRRNYDAAHLKRHPGQETVSALLSFRYRAEGEHIERIALQRKGQRSPLHFVGSCEWRAQANRDSSGKKLIAAYSKSAGYDCLVVTSPSSAEEGGYFLIDLAANGKSVMLYLDSPIVTWGGSFERRAGVVDLGRDDRVFRLNRTAATDCKGIEEALEGP